MVYTSIHLTSFGLGVWWRVLWFAQVTVLLTHIYTHTFRHIVGCAQVREQVHGNALFLAGPHRGRREFMKPKRDNNA